MRRRRSSPTVCSSTTRRASRATITSRPTSRTSTGTTDFPTRTKPSPRPRAHSRPAPPWTFSPHGDAQRRGDEPLICSEFGVWGLPHPREILEKDGSEPWWFESGHDRNDGCAYPHGIETRFRDAGLAPIFGDVDGFVDAAQEFQYRALKYQIETLRWERPISGYVITELNDVQWESNGLMDVRNRPRRFADRLANLQRPWLVIARAPRTAIGVGESVEVAVRLAGAEESPKGAKLAWRFARSDGPRRDWRRADDDHAAGARRARAIAVHNLELEASDGAGRLLSRNSLEFCVVPRLAAPRRRFMRWTRRRDEILAALDWPNRAALAGRGGRRIWRRA